VETLLAETSWLRRLADELVPKADREDLVQDVLLRALQQPAAPRSPRAWLATVARHIASRTLLRRQRRTARELEVGAARGASPSAADAAEHFATHRAVIAAIDALDEPLRTVVLLRFFEGLPPREVARRTGVPVETARTRQKRAVERLRQILDERPGGRRAWVLGLVSLPGVATTAAVPAALLSLLPFLAMKPLVAGLVALLLTGIWFAWPAPTDLPGLATANPTRGEIAAVESGTPTATSGSGVAAPARVLAEPLPRGALVAVVRRKDGSPVPNVGLDIWPSDRPASRSFVHTDEQGTTLSEALEPGPYVVHLDRGQRREIRVLPGERTTCTFELEPGCTVKGTVERVDRQRVAAATIVALDANHPDVMVALGQSDTDGAFVLHDVPERTRLLAQKPGWQPSSSRGVGVTRGPGAEQTIRLVLGAEAFALAGTVFAPDGRPAPYAHVLVAVDEDCRKRLAGLVEVRATDGKGGLDREAILVRADASGRFATAEIPFGEIVVFARGTGELAACTGIATTTVQRTSGNAVDVRLQAGASVQGVVRDAAGVAHGGFELRLAYDESPTLGELDRDVLADSLLDRRATVARDGAFRFDGVLPAEYDLRRDVGLRGEQLRKVDVPADGLRLDLVVPRLRALRVRVQDDQGLPLPGFAVVATRDATISMQQARRSTTDAGGVCTIPAISGDAVWLHVHAPRTDEGADEPFCRFPSFVQRLVELESEVLVVAAAPTAGLALRVLDAEGQACAAARVTLVLPPSDEKVRATADQNGAVRRTGMPAGTYRVVVSSGQRSIEREVVLQDGQVLDLGDLGLPAAARLEVEVVVDGRPVADASIRLFRASPGTGNAAATWTPLDTLGEGSAVRRSAPLDPGEYWLQVAGPSFAPVGEMVTLTSGSPKRVRVVPEPGCEQRFLVALSDPADRDANEAFAAIEVLDGAGRPVVARAGTMPVTKGPDAVAEFVVRLRPGSYTVRAHGRTGAGETTVVVGTTNAPVRIQLR